MVLSSLELVHPPLFLVQDTDGYSMALFVTDQYGAVTNIYSEDVTGQMQTAVAAPQNEAGAAPQKGAGAPLESSKKRHRQACLYLASLILCSPCWSLPFVLLQST